MIGEPFCADLSTDCITTAVNAVSPALPMPQIADASWANTTATLVRLGESDREFVVAATDAMRKRQSADDHMSDAVRRGGRKCPHPLF
jgi:hypothetical protein